MKHIQQPNGSNQCGQACVAMLTGYSLKEIVKEMGTGKTSTRDLCNALGLSIRRLETFGAYYLPKGSAILKVTWNNKKSHWVVLNDMCVYDPEFSGSMTLNEYMTWLSDKGRITSYLNCGYILPKLSVAASFTCFLADYKARLSS